MDDSENWEIKAEVGTSIMAEPLGSVAQRKVSVGELLEVVVVLKERE